MATNDEVPTGATKPRSLAPPAPARSLPPHKTSRWRRGLQILCVGVLGLEALYLVAANLFLNLWFGVLFAGTNSIDIQLGRAWTLWPGDVEVRQVRVLFQDHNLQWSLDIERANVGLKLAPLFRKTFHATRVVGEGTVFRMRHRVEPSSVNEPAVAALPEIPEFPAPAVFESRVPDPPVTDENYDLWTVHLENVDVGLREAWAQQFRYVGAGRARGSFRLRPARQLWVGPATLDLEPGRLSAGSSQVTPALSGRIVCTVHPFDVRGAAGRDVFRHFSVELDLVGRELDLGFVRLFRPDDPALIRGTAGDLRIAARTKRGVLTDGSRIELERRGLVLEHPQLTTEIQRLKLVLLALSGRGKAELEVDQAALRFGATPVAPMTIEVLRASAASSSLDLTADWRMTELSLDELQAVLPDLKAFAPMLASRGVRSLEGSAVWSARGSYGDSLFDGELHAALERVRLRTGKSVVELDGQASLGAVRASLETRSGSLSGILDATRMKVTNDGASSFEAGGVRLEAMADAANGSGRGSVKVKLSNLHGRAGGWRFETQAELFGALEDWNVARGTSRSSVRGTFRDLVATSPESNLRIRAEKAALRSLTKTEGKASARAPSPAELAFDVTLSGVRFEQGAGEGESAEVTGVAGVAETLDVTARLASQANGTLGASVHSSARGLRANYGKLRFTATPSVTLAIDELDQARGLGRIRADLTMLDFSATDPEGDADCPWSKIARTSVQANAELRGERGPKLTLHALLEGARLVWGDFSTRSPSAKLDASFDSAALEDGGRLELNLDVREPRLASGTAAPRGWDARSPALELAAKLEQTPGRLSGTLRVGAAAVDTRLGYTSFRARVQTIFERATFDFAQGHLTGTGKMLLRDLEIGSKDERVEDWWADISLDSLDLWAKENLEGVARFSATLRDGLPALTVLASHGDLPGFVPDVFPLRDLQARGSVRRRCRLTDFRVDEVSGGPFVANGRLQSVPDSVRGAFLVRLAAAEVFGAGIHFDSKGSGVSLLSGQTWFKKQSVTLDRYALDAKEQVCVPAPRECGE